MPTRPLGHSASHLAECTREHRTKPEGGRAKRPVYLTAVPARPSRASLPEPITPEMIGLREMCHQATVDATDDILHLWAEDYPHFAYPSRKADCEKNPLYRFCAWVMSQRNVGQREHQSRQYEVVLLWLLKRLHGTPDVSRLPMAQALETRAEGNANTIADEIRARIAAGETITAQQYREFGRALAVEISSDVDLFYLVNAMAESLEAAERAASGAASPLTVVKS